MILGTAAFLFIIYPAAAATDEEVKLYFTGDISGGGEGTYTPIAPSGNPSSVEVWPQGSLPSQEERRYVGSWNITLEGPLTTATEFKEMEFKIILANGQGTDGNPNDINVEMELGLEGNGPYLGESTTVQVGTDDVEFVFPSEDFELDMAEGELLSVLFYVIWNETDPGDTLGPNDLEVRYDGGSYQCGVTFECQQVSYDNQDATVDRTGKRATIFTDVLDAFGEVDLDPEGYEIRIMNEAETFNASDMYISFEDKTDDTLEWEWDYGSNEAEPDNYTATIWSTDIRENKWKTEVPFEVEEGGNGGGETNYGVTIAVVQGGHTKRISPQERAEFKLKVTNSGDDTDDFTLSLEKEPLREWNYVLEKSISNLAADAYKTITLEVWPESGDMEDEDQVEIAVVVESQGAKNEGKEAKDTVSTTTIIEIIRDFDAQVSSIESEYTSFVSPAIFLLRVENTGNVDDTYTWTITNQGEWEVLVKRSSIEIDSVLLENEESTTLRVEVYVKGDSEEDDEKSIRLELRSSYKFDLTRTVTFTAAVRFDLDVDHGATNKKIKIEQEKKAKITLTIANDAQESLEFRFEVSSEQDIDELDYYFEDKDGNDVDFAVDIEAGDDVTIYLYIKPSEDMETGDYTILVEMVTKKGSKKLTTPIKIVFKVEEKEEDELDMMMVLPAAALVVVGAGIGGILLVRSRKKRRAALLLEAEEKEKEKEGGEEKEEEEIEYSGEEVKEKEPSPEPTPPAPPAAAQAPTAPAIKPAIPVPPVPPVIPPAAPAQIPGVAPATPAPHVPYPSLQPVQPVPEVGIGQPVVTVGAPLYPQAPVIVGAPPRKRRPPRPSGKRSFTVGENEDKAVRTVGSEDKDKEEKKSTAPEEEEFIIKDIGPEEPGEFTVGGEADEEEFFVGAEAAPKKKPAKAAKKPAPKKRKPKPVVEELEIEEMEIVEEVAPEEDYYEEEIEEEMFDEEEYGDGAYDEDYEEEEEEEDKKGLFGGGKAKSKKDKGKKKDKKKKGKGKKKGKSTKGKDKTKGKGKKGKKKKKKPPVEEEEEEAYYDEEEYYDEEVYDEDLEIEY